MSEFQEKYPNNRLRRTRQSQWIRNLVSENSLSTNDLIWPIFICEGSNVKDEIDSMPGVYRYSVDRLNEVVDQALLNKISLIALFPYTPKEKKDSLGSEALSPDNLICSALKKIKEKKLILGQDIGIISYNDTLLKEIVEGGITTISTDFNKMGKNLASMVMMKKRDKIENPNRIMIRKSL